MTDNARGTRSAVTETDLELGDGRKWSVTKLPIQWQMPGLLVDAPPQFPGESLSVIGRI